MGYAILYGSALRNPAALKDNEQHDWQNAPTQICSKYVPKSFLFSNPHAMPMGDHHRPASPVCGTTLASRPKSYMATPIVAASSSFQACPGTTWLRAFRILASVSARHCHDYDLEDRDAVSSPII